MEVYSSHSFNIYSLHGNIFYIYFNMGLRLNIKFSFTQVHFLTNFKTIKASSVRKEGYYDTTLKPEGSAALAVECVLWPCPGREALPAQLLRIAPSSAQLGSLTRESRQ